MQEPYDSLVEISKKHQKMNGCHGFEHTERVIKLCEVLGDRLGADMTVLLPAAILHDIGRPNDKHASVGAEKSRQILLEYGYNRDKIGKISNAIISHSFSEGRRTESLEAQILSDADKLDAMGAIGVYRTALYSGELNRPFHEFVDHFHEKLLTLKDLLYTDEAKRIAEERHSYMLTYLEQLDKELKAEG
ncbi:MAG: HD domain-containing protein [Candidatus Bathyarchaeota archaeon]|nr:HD domain-containing protein [Candidatus Bathyarchaeota archaeon]